MAKATKPPQAEKSKGKPPRPDGGPEAQLQDRAGLPADSGAGDPRTNTPGEGSSGTAREAPSTGSGTTAETSSVGVQPGSPYHDQGGAGGVEAGPAEAYTLDALVNLDARLAGEERALRLRYPRLSASIDTWQSLGREELPDVLRISSRREGFRRAGMRHGKGPFDHPIERFTPDQIEQLLAEPELTVELVAADGDA